MSKDPGSHALQRLPMIDISRSVVVWRDQRQSLSHRQAQTHPACRRMAFLAAMLPHHNGCTGHLASGPHLNILVPGHIAPSATENSMYVHRGLPFAPFLPDSLGRCSHVGLLHERHPHRPRLPLPWGQSPRRRRPTSHSSNRSPITSARTQNS